MPVPPPSDGDKSHDHLSTATRAHTCTSTLKQRRTPIPAPHLQPAMRAHIRTTTFNRRRGPMPVPPPSNGDERSHPHHHLQTATSTHTRTTTFQQRRGPTPTPPPSTAMNAHVRTSTLKRQPALMDGDGCLQQQRLAHTNDGLWQRKWRGHCQFSICVM